MKTELLTIKELADILRVHVNTARRYVASGKIKALKIEQSWLIRKSDLEAYIENEINKVKK